MRYPPPIRGRRFIEISNTGIRVARFVVLPHMRMPPDTPESQDSSLSLSNDTPWWMQTEVANSLNSDARMADLSPLREKARDAIRRGALPSRRQDHTMGVSGSQCACIVCGDVVPSIMLAFEIGFRARSP